MPAQVPASAPRAGYTAVINAATVMWRAKYGHNKLPGMFVLAVRAYRMTTMGNPDTNDLNMYDDAVFVVDTVAGTCRGFNANTDPTRYGWNPNADKYMARIKPGCYTFRPLYHRRGAPTGHPAFGQASAVTVERIRENGTIAVTETGQFGIHDHRGGNNTTSSEGCITHPPEDWDSYRDYLKLILKNRDMDDGYTFIVVDGPIV